MPDMRDELVTYGGVAAYGGRRFDKDSPAEWEEVAARVLDSIPPGSYKNHSGEWVAVPPGSFIARRATDEIDVL